MTGRSVARLLAAWLTLPAPGWACPIESIGPPTRRTVLTIHWGQAEFPATPVVNTVIREALTSPSRPPVDYFAEYLESDRLPAREVSLALRDYIRRKYCCRHIDVVIAIADPALQFVMDYRDDLFGDAPIVYSGVGIAETIGPHIGRALTGVMRGVAYAETLNLALELHPSTERVFVVAHGHDKQTDESVRTALHDFSTRVNLTYIEEETLPRLLDAIKGVPHGSLVLYIWHAQPDLGLDMYDVARLVVEAAPVPVYGTNEDYIGVGVVGGMVRGRRETATRLGHMARAILDGARPEDIPIENARLVPTFDWRQVRRWGIDPARLPAGSDIRFRVPTVWESYRSYIVGTFAVIAAQLLLIAGLLTQRAKTRRAEATVRTRETTLRTSYDRIRQLAGRLINAQEAARADIARDLHDDVCQQLVGVSIAVSSLKRSSGHIEDTNTQQVLSELERTALDSVEGIRRLSHELHPASLRLLGLAPALKAHCVEVEKRHDVQVSFDAADDLGTIQHDVAVCLFRIGQEALRNGAVHGDARRLAVSLARSGDRIELTVKDDGRGFDLDAVRRGGGGLGLVSMEERARVLGGDVTIVTLPQRGTTIRVRVPAGADVHSGAEDARADAAWPPQPLPESEQICRCESSDHPDRRRSQGHY